MKRQDLSGKKFGRLTVIKVHEYKNQKLFWHCVCDCGKTTNVTAFNLTHNKIRSCGCLKTEELINRSTTHNQRHTKLYEVWKTMKQRCYNPENSSYHNYGARGIIVCDEWKNNFESFYIWSKSNGYKEGLSIDRIDVNGNYEPGNCRWTTRLVQANNTRVNRYITINNETKSLSEWCRFYNISCSAIYNRIKKGMNLIDALTTPSKRPKTSK